MSEVPLYEEHLQLGVLGDKQVVFGDERFVFDDQLHPLRFQLLDLFLENGALFVLLELEKGAPDLGFRV